MSRYSDLVIADSPMHYWRLGESSGTLVDVIAANNGTAGAGVTYGTAGALSADADTAITLDGAATAIVTMTQITIPAVGTWEIWGNVTTMQDCAFLAQWSGSSGVMLQPTTGPNEMHFGVNGTFVIATMPSFPAWHYYVGTYDGTTARLFINEAEAGNALVGSPSSPATPLVIGKYAGSAELIGSVDEPAIYNYVLSPAQRAAHYAVGRDLPAAVRADYSQFPKTPLRRVA